MSWIRTGSVAVTLNSPAVVGTGTNLDSFRPGDGFRLKGAANPLYEILSITDATHLALTQNYAGATLTGQEFEILPLAGLRSSIVDASQRTSDIIDKFGELLAILANDRTLTLNRANTSANSGVLLQAVGADEWRAGVFGDGAAATSVYRIQRKVAAAWVDVLTIDKTTGVITFGSGAFSGSINPRNRSANGAMLISQENIATAVDINAATKYVVDQWVGTANGGGVLRGQQVLLKTPGGSPKRLRWSVQTVDASIAATDNYRFEHPIEGQFISDALFGTAGAQSITVRFGCRISLAGTYTISLRNGAGDRSRVQEFSISAGEAGIDVVKTVTFAGDASGTWLTNNGTGLIIAWDLGSGVNFEATANAWSAGKYSRTANQANWIATAGATFDVFDVGVYVGATAPSWELPAFDRDLASCMRYWEKSYDTDVAPGAVNSTLGLEVRAVQSNTVANLQKYPTIPFKIAKRASVSGTVYGFGGGAGKVSDDNGTDLAAGSGSLVFGGTQSMIARNNSGGSVTTQNGDVIFHWTVDARLGL